MINWQIILHNIANRFVGFATLPINEPEAAAREFERYINDLRIKKGALIYGTVHKMVLLGRNRI